MHMTINIDTNSRRLC